ncbi:MAG: hypothetical protein HQ564_09880 [Candidatus Saganbacteria bacterium]|nr:hypothetical protein [Candidatus Saganbacteria bacterium]
MKLSGTILETKLISKLQKTQMYELMCNYYENLDQKTFQSDLDKKKWALILEDKSNKIRGFSTLTVFDFTIDNTPVKGVFSGDTIIHSDYVWELEFQKKWIEFVFNIVKQYPKHKCYWLLISKGYKTYRFLPLYFKEFHPCYDKKTPDFEKKIMDSYAKYLFSDDYDPKSGIVYNRGKRNQLRPGVAEISPSRLKNPHIKFFAEKNPGHKQGDELVCIASFAKDNLKKIIKRMSK